MTRLRSVLPAVALAALALELGASPAAFAQTGPPGAPPGGTVGEEEPKPEGVAEKAPADPAQLPTIPTLPPYPGETRKKFELLELDGLFRFRTDWFSNFHLGFQNEGAGTPFREPLSCLTDSRQGCSDTLNSANMRLRLEPVINVSEQVAVRMQIDVLDNLVLGATPEGVFLDPSNGPPPNIPANAFAGGQAPMEAGRNYITDSIRVKRAWGEVKIPNIGVVRVGRMPSHWGLGILANSGAADPYHGTYCMDCDYGDTADRLMFGTMIPGTQLRVAVGKDWASSEPTSAQVDLWQNRYDGQPWDLDDADDVDQWIFVLAHMAATPDEWKNRVDSGDLALDYGAYVVYRSQEYETRDYTLGTGSAEGQLVYRGVEAYIPDLWVRLGWRKLSFEAELAGVIGSVDDLSDVSANVTDQDIRQFGGVARLNYLAADDDLNLGLEVGFATGDSYDATTPGSTNVRDVLAVPTLAEDKTIEAFKFDFDYHVDLILFRELLGTVTNATYIKPSMSYALTDRFKFSAAGIVSMANRPVATPGNSTFYGVELDGDLGYANEKEGFFAGLTYGVFFPLAAMNHPETPAGETGPGYGFSENEEGDAETAMTLQTRIMIKF